MARKNVAPVWVINPPLHDAAKTFCVLGVARGGTSMVAGLLRQLDVRMGENLDPANVEDLDFVQHKGFRRIFWHPSETEKKREYLTYLERLVAAKNQKFPVWGWKDPIAIHYLPEIAGKLRNPHYVLVVRDAGAVAIREMVEWISAPQPDVGIFLDRALGEYKSCAEFVLKVNRPALLISYERALRDPDATCRLLAEFVHGFEWADRHEQRLLSLANFIVPERGSANAVVAPRRGQRRGSPSGTNDPIARLFGSLGDYGSEIRRLAGRGTVFDETLAVAAARDGADRVMLATYAAAADAIQTNELEAAETLAARCFSDYLTAHPVLDLGPCGVARAVEVNAREARALPELVVGIFNILGLSQLLQAKVEEACDSFYAGYLLARWHLERAPARERHVALDLVWWLAFHAAVAAKAAGRSFLQTRCIGDLEGYLAKVDMGGEDHLNAASARQMLQRARSEQLILESSQ